MWVQDFFNANCVSISFLALVVYDYLCTIDQEVAYVWSNPFSVGVVLFYLNRYLVFIDQGLLLEFNMITTGNGVACEKLFRVGLWVKTIGENVSSVIIYLQTCAIWGNRKSVVIPLFFLQLGRIVVSLTLAHMQWDSKIAEYVAPASFRHFCIILVPIIYVRYVYLVICITEATTICFTLIKAFQHMRRSNSPWVIQLYKNGILYSVCILLFAVVNLIVPELPVESIYMGIMVRPQRVMEVILCNRVMFVIFQHRKHRKRYVPDGAGNYLSTAVFNVRAAGGVEAEDSRDIFTSIPMNSNLHKRTFDTVVSEWEDDHRVSGSGDWIT